MDSSDPKSVATRTPNAPSVQVPPQAAPLTAPINTSRLSKKQRKKLLRAGMQVSVSEFYAGLLPHPEHLERFEKLLPGTTDRLITMAEKQGDHRQAMERKFLNVNGFAQVAGVLFGGIIALASIGGGIWLLSTGHSLVEFTAMLSPLGLIALGFLRTRSRQRTEIERKK